MTPAQIVQAFGQRLETMPAAPPVVWEDQNANPARPCLSVQHVPTIRDEVDLAGGGLWQEGYFVVSILTPRGDMRRQADTIAAAILAHFPKALRLGGLVILGARIAGPSYHDGADLRTPVRVGYRLT